MSNFIIYAFHEPGKICEIHGNACPCYIGKGRPNRPKDHFKDSRLQRNTHFYNKLNKLIAKGIQPLVRTIAADLTEQEAFDIEIKLIALYGRQDNKTGCLCNHTNGGEGICGGRPSYGGLGREVSLERRIELSQAKSKEICDINRLAQRYRAIPVESYSLTTGQTIKQYATIRDVELDGYSRTRVKGVIEGRYRFRSHGWYGWRYSKIESSLEVSQGQPLS